MAGSPHFYVNYVKITTIFQLNSSLSALIIDCTLSALV